MFVPATLPSLAHSWPRSSFAPWRQEPPTASRPSFGTSLLGVGVGLHLVRSAKPRSEAESRSRASEVQKLFQSALSLTDQGLTDEAVSVYRRLVEIDPSRPEAFLNLGLCLASKGEEAEALEAIDKALAIDDMYDDAHYNRGLILDDMGMVEDALASFGRAEESATRLGEVENAAQYSAAIGMLLLSEQRYSEALAAYDRAISRWPGSADFWTARGEALCELGRFDDALASQRKALDLCAETDPGLLYNLALTYAGMGDVEGCGDALQKALDEDRMQVLAISQNFAGDGELFAQRRQEEAAFLHRRVQETEHGGPERERWERLEEIVAALRRLEEDPLWLRDRLLDSSSGRDQTAYGSTWFESWCQLVDAGALHCTASAPQQMVVFGSSIGWQCFLGHVHLGYAPCIGFEVLASQVSAAQRVSEELGLGGSVQFLCQDALEANVSEAGLVWLNTYAWPADIKRRAVQKLLQELPEGSQVVSYEPLPTEALSFQGRNLHLQTTVNLEASWDPDLTAQVYRLEEEKETDRPRFGRGFKFQSF